VRVSISVASIVDKGGENRLRWFGHVIRWEKTKAVRVVMKMNVKRKRGRWRQKKRWLDTIQNDLRVIGVCIRDVETRGSLGER
jgi:hypothetical protein